MRNEARSAVHLQYAALPWRKNGDVLEVLLITTLRTGRWIVPKGWPIDGLAPFASAAQEALEEAGIAGEIGQHPLGAYTYKKLRKSGEIVTCKVDVFSLLVKSQKRTWSEKAARQLCWLPVPEAMNRVSEAGLRRLILKFANLHRAPQRAPVVPRAARKPLRK